ncbi:hypothetical protein ACFW9N_19260 [Streptomyces sp. NPDC059496]|uniref:hypothetical protein n=1 Tax=Streptomyces sp. NPDC059496 TaxID=3346851 RepID=UPI0036ACE6CF
MELVDGGLVLGGEGAGSMAAAEVSGHRAGLLLGVGGGPLEDAQQVDVQVLDYDRAAAGAEFAGQ